MSKLNQFLESADTLLKGRKPAAVGTISKDGKRRKAADGSWKPIRKQRAGKSKPTKQQPTRESQTKRAREWIAEVQAKIKRAKSPKASARDKSLLPAYQSELKDAQRFQRAVKKYWEQYEPKWQSDVKAQWDIVKQKGAKVGDKVRVHVGTHMMYGPQYGTGTLKENKQGQPYISIPPSQSIEGKYHRWTVDSVAWSRVKGAKTQT